MVEKIQRTRLFRGFSSVNKITPDTELVDINLVKQDLLNHFHTALGERVMRPAFGSIIWDLLFDPFDVDTRETIIADVQNIISQEPRVELQDIQIVELEHGLRINAAVLYVPFNVVETFEIDFDRRNRSRGPTILAESIEDLS